MLGLIARSDLGSGLQSQTYNLARMLRPDRILIVNSTSFNGAEQHDELYDGFNVQKTLGWPTNMECARFMRGLTHVVTAETVYNPKIYEIARMRRAKVFTQPNWEFLDHLTNPSLPKPTSWLMPSYWHLEDMKNIFSNTVYLPPPIFMNDFKEARDINLKRFGRRRFVHVVGKLAAHDRNGTYDVIDAMKYSIEDFELVIRSRHPIPDHLELATDHRITFDMRDIEDPSDLYKDFDAMIMPRRYGGLCLPMNEALASGLPVIMTDISPNNQVLPKEWLVEATSATSFKARTMIDVHRTNPILLAKKMDVFAKKNQEDLEEMKLTAYNIAYDNYSSDSLKQKYKEVMGL